MQVHPDRKWFMDLEAGELSIQFVPMVTVLVESKSMAEVRWNKKGLQKIAVNKDLVMRIFGESTNNATNIEWCS